MKGEAPADMINPHAHHILFKTGNQEGQADLYDYHEIYLENGKRLDSYAPDAGEIISRKATDLDKITEETYRGYLSEFSKKYSKGTKIRSNAYPELDGQELKGQYILEIPASNDSIKSVRGVEDS